MGVESLDWLLQPSRQSYHGIKKSNLCLRLSAKVMMVDRDVDLFYDRDLNSTDPLRGEGGYSICLIIWSRHWWIPFDEIPKSRSTWWNCEVFLCKCFFNMLMSLLFTCSVSWNRLITKNALSSALFTHLWFCHNVLLFFGFYFSIHLTPLYASSELSLLLLATALSASHCWNVDCVPAMVRGSVWLTCIAWTLRKAANKSKCLEWSTWH